MIIQWKWEIDLYDQCIFLAKLYSSLPCFILYFKAKFACYSRCCLTSYFCIPIPYNEKDISLGVLVLKGLVLHMHIFFILWSYLFSFNIFSFCCQSSFNHVFVLVWKSTLESVYILTLFILKSSHTDFLCHS